MQVALLQAQLKQAAASDNRAQLAQMMDHCPAHTELFVLPETFATGFLGDGDRVPESMTGASVQWLQQQARARHSALCGSLVIGAEDHHGQQLRYNRLVYVDKQGEILGTYDKRHLFGYGGENQRYTAGQQRVIIRDQVWRICVQICYDLRFPVWCRHRQDYDMLLFVANWPAQRVSAWQHLLRARAIENQCYVIGVNRAGPDGANTIYGGCSAIYGPLGETIVELGQQPGIASACLDLDHVTNIRQQLPFQADADDFHWR